MIGLVNAIGTADTAQVQGQVRAAETNRQQDQSNLAPILSNEVAASKVLRTGIQTMDSTTEDSANRGAPGNGQSDRFQQADSESTAQNHDGLDLYA